MFAKKIFGIIALLSFSLLGASGFKILGIIPTMAKSHFIVSSSLMKALAEKGHEVTVISAFPQAQPIKNYRDIPTLGILEKTKAMMDNAVSSTRSSPMSVIQTLSEFCVWITSMTVEEPEIQKFLRSNEQFDLIILEVFGNEALLGFAATFKAPVVALSSFGSNIWISDMVGSLSPPSFIPNNFVLYDGRMNLFERIGNFLVTAYERVYNDYIHLPKQKHIYDTMFPGDDKPDFYALRKNVSLALLNSHFSVSIPRLYATNMIEVGGMHINRKRKPLPEDLQKFLDEATDGAIYFSMGSIVKGATLPKEKVEQIIKTFGALKQRILWKWEDKELATKPPNVMVKNWFPQDDVLAHPNVKLFITHGGLLSTIEAIYHSVPIVGVPVYGDQFLNVLRVEKAGLGVSLPLVELTGERLKEAIDNILYTGEFKMRAKEVSQRYREQPLTPMETAVFWVEYVARHKGAHHLKSLGQELSFIQYHSLDVLAICIGVVCTALLLVLYAAIVLIRICLRKLRNRQTEEYIGAPFTGKKKV